MRWPFRRSPWRAADAAADGPRRAEWATLAPLEPVAARPIAPVGRAAELAEDRRRAVAPVRLGVPAEQRIAVAATRGEVVGVMTPIAVLPPVSSPEAASAAQRDRELVVHRLPAAMPPRTLPVSAAEPVAAGPPLTTAAAGWGAGLVEVAGALPAGDGDEVDAGTASRLRPPRPDGAPAVMPAEDLDAMAPVAPERARPNLGQSRRRGLGAPLRLRPDDDEGASPEPVMTPVREAPIPPVSRREPDAEPPVDRPEPIPPAPAPPRRPVSADPEPVPAPVHRHIVARRPPVAPRPEERPAAPLAADAPPLPDVPVAVRRQVSELLGADVGQVRVHRGDEARTVARRLRARALTRDGEVLLPAEHGPLDQGRARGLLAHELTHVVQQRRLGGALPREDSAAGRRLEEEARVVERAVTGQPAPAASPEAPDQEALAGLAAQTRALAEELSSAGLAHLDAAGAIVFGLDPLPTAPGRAGSAPRHGVPPHAPAAAASSEAARVAPDPAPGVPAGVQRAPDEPGAAPAPIPAPPGAPAFDAVLPGSVPVAPVAAAAPSLAPPAPVAVAAFEAPPASLPAAPVTTVAPAPAAAAAGEPVEPAPVAPPELDIDDLARRLYPPLSRRLRAELLVDRERAGRATDLVR